MSDSILIATLDKGRETEIRVALDEFRGQRRIDIRTFVPFSAAKVPIPTKRGAAIPIEALPALAAALNDAIGKAREIGWLPQEGAA